MALLGVIRYGDRVIGNGGILTLPFFSDIWWQNVSAMAREPGELCVSGVQVTKTNRQSATRILRPRRLAATGSYDMVRKQFNIFKSYCKALKGRFFPSVRAAALLIVIPAVVIVPIYFLTVVKEVVVDRRRDAGAAYEERFAEISRDLPPHTPFNYISDYSDHTDFFFARYALIPGRMVLGPEPAQDLLVIQYLTTPGLPSFEGYKLVRNYGDGVMLFKRNDD